MSDRFRNVVFVLCVVGCLASVGVNSFLTRDTFNSLSAQAAEAQQITVAQDYGIELLKLTQYEVARVKELESHIERISSYAMQLQSEFQMLQISCMAQGEYITQLMSFIEDNDLAVPEYGCDEDNCSVDDYDDS